MKLLAGILMSFGILLIAGSTIGMALYGLVALGMGADIHSLWEQSERLISVGCSAGTGFLVMGSLFMLLQS